MFCRVRTTGYLGTAQFVPGCPGTELWARVLRRPFGGVLDERRDRLLYPGAGLDLHCKDVVSRTWGVAVDGLDWTQRRDLLQIFQGLTAVAELACKTVGCGKPRLHQATPGPTARPGVAAQGRREAHTC